jgi:hypothetical protein
MKALSIPMILATLLSAPALAGPPKGPAPVHLIPLDDDFPAAALAGPGIEIQTNQKPVGKNGPLPVATLRRIQAELHLELPAAWDALEQDLFFGRAEFQDEATLSNRYGAMFTSHQLAELRQALRRARAEALRRGEKQ